MEFVTSVSALDSAAWNECAGQENPFVCHQFLSALEDSGCVGEESGWLPQPLLARSAEGRVVGILPCYLKLHSKGEYIFDYHWAEAYHRMMDLGARYYPKLQVAVPFTPVPGHRILLSPSAPQGSGEQLLRALRTRVEQEQLSSAHLTFCSESEFELGQSVGYLPRTGEQYHWYNEDYTCFEDFLSRLTSRKRKAIKRERRIAQSHGLEVRTLHGRQITARQLDAFFAMYHRTCMRKWGSPYLSREFFELLVERMPDQTVFVLAFKKGDDIPVAGAWNLKGSNALFGRNWGELEHYDMLHFEVCYYRAIEYAVEHGLQRVEAGAQGPHKIQRGYRPRFVYSLHHIAHAGFRRAIQQYLRDERAETAYRVQALSDWEPFKSGSTGVPLNEGTTDQG